MRTLMLVVLVLASACSSKKSATDAATDGVSHIDSPPLIDAPIDGHVTQGGCASCTANMCLPELQACGASQGCVTDLIAFNNCMMASGSTCGTMFASGGAAQATLWGCLMTKCMDSCGTT